MEESLVRKPKMWEALIPIVFLILSLSSTILIFGGDPQIPLLATTIVAALVGKRVGYNWEQMEQGIFDTILPALQAILIQMIIGIIIGTWIIAGIVPTMIYYGLKILSPGIFLPATCLICAIVSLATGSAWTTAGTVGIALLGVGQGLEISTPLVAGAIISGAYFGDKMSPLSDSTNLAPAVTGTNLFDHINHMIKTTGVSFILAMIGYSIVGMKYAGKELDVEGINRLLTALGEQFQITPILLIPPILVILMVIFKMPAIPGLLGGSILGGIFAYFFQGAKMGKIIKASHYGYVSETGFEAVDKLLTRGGLDSMMWTVSLILVAMSFGGVMEKIGILEVIGEKLLTFATSTGSLVLTTALTCIFCNFTMSDQYLAIVVPGRMFKKKYEEQGLHPKNLSRVLEDTGTLTSSLVPWSTCGAFMSTTLSVHPFAYLPYAFLNLINPVVSVLYGYIGFTMDKLDDEDIATVK
ncbi:Na+/H+ antiporter NhaC [Anaerophilus nitritogenes]|uniref:Na+/H+ antiporter NhaC n=1 Tax=Anaerophilus nitritogenes TaxID=2498136 RepID=UPI00101C342B|nr:Na+/H+ antiporter NhaC [Anaerophilus nitritogenes]